MLLENKNAVIYGGGGGIGGGVARTFAREGATVFLVGRTPERLEAVAKDVTSAGGRAEVAVVDALDERAVDEHVQTVVAEVGSLDISLNLVSRGDVQGIPLVDMTAADLMGPVTTGLTTMFLTSRAAARQMVQQGSGVILSVTSGSAAPGKVAPMMGGTGPADAAVETYLRYLAGEVGPQGVRVVGLLTAAVWETMTSPEAKEKISEVAGDAAPSIDQLEAMFKEMATLGRAPRLAEVAETATFLASDRAAAITGSLVNVTCGLV